LTASRRSILIDGTDLLKEVEIKRFDLEERGWKLQASCQQTVVSQS